MATDERSISQFFFELGYGACWADAVIAEPKFAQVLPLSDAAVERAWAILPDCQDLPEDYAEFDSKKAVADAAPTLHHELVEARTTLSILRTQIMVEIGRCADPSESRWDGVPEKLQERIAAIDAAIAQAEARS